jgi:hypothetical protein
VSLKIYAVYAVDLIFGLEQYRLMLQFNRFQVWALKPPLIAHCGRQGSISVPTHSTTSDEARTLNLRTGRAVSLEREGLGDALEGALLRIHPEREFHGGGYKH